MGGLQHQECGETANLSVIVEECVDPSHEVIHRVAVREVTHD